MQTIDGIVNEPTVNFVGKDGFFWWVGEVEDNEDPMKLGRVKVRVLGYYTNVLGKTNNVDLPTDKLLLGNVSSPHLRQVMMVRVNPLVSCNLVLSSWDSSWMAIKRKCLLLLKFF